MVRTRRPESGTGQPVCQKPPVSCACSGAGSGWIEEWNATTTNGNANRRTISHSPSLDGGEPSEPTLHPLRRVPVSVRFVVLGFVLAGTFAWGGSASPRAPSDPPPRAAFATVRLHPLPLQALNQCRLARAIAFCPRRLPLASLPGWRAPRGTPPPILVAQRYRPFRDGRARLVGVSFGYGAPWEPDSGPDWRQHLWRNRPCCFLHFELYRAIKGTPPMAAHVERAPLGGRSGLLAAAAGYGLGCDGPFFCNHLRFYWRERGSWYVATLHHFGVPETRTLLDRLVRELRPVRTLQPGRPHVVATIRIGGFPNALAVGDGTVWIVGGGRRSGRIVRIDQSSNRVAARIRAPVGSERSCGIATAGGSVWAAAYDPGSRRTTVLRIDPKRARIGGRRVGLQPRIANADPDRAQERSRRRPHPEGGQLPGRNRVRLRLGLGRERHTAVRQPPPTLHAQPRHERPTHPHRRAHEPRRRASPPRSEPGVRRSGRRERVGLEQRRHDPSHRPAHESARRTSAAGLRRTGHARSRARPPLGDLDHRAGETGNDHARRPPPRHPRPLRHRRPEPAGDGLPCRLALGRQLQQRHSQPHRALNLRIRERDSHATPRYVP